MKNNKYNVIREIGFNPHKCKSKKILNKYLNEKSIYKHHDQNYLIKYKKDFYNIIEQGIIFNLEYPSEEYEYMTLELNWNNESNYISAYLNNKIDTHTQLSFNNFIKKLNNKIKIDNKIHIGYSTRYIKYDNRNLELLMFDINNPTNIIMNIIFNNSNQKVYIYNNEGNLIKKHSYTFFIKKLFDLKY